MSNSSKKLDYFNGHLIKVFTLTEISAGQDEDGNELMGRQVYIGWLLDHDDTWVILGEFVEEKAYANAAIKVDQIAHIEFKSQIDDPVESDSKMVN